MKLRAWMAALLPALVIQSGCVTVGTLTPSAPGVDELIGAVTTLGSAIRPIDLREEIEIGRTIAANVAGKYGLVRDVELTRYVSLVGKIVAGRSERPDIPYHFAVLDTDIINAFSCPGGYVFVTRGTLNTVCSEAELAAVLAHEISHVAKKHIVKEIEKQKFFRAGNEVAGTLLNTDLSVFNAVTSFGTGLLFKGLSRSDEYQADERAVTYLVKSGYDPTALLTFLEKIKTDSGASGAEGVKLLFATHPQIEDRIKKVQTEIAKIPRQELNGELLTQRFIEHVRLQAGIR